MRGMGEVGQRRRRGGPCFVGVSMPRFGGCCAKLAGKRVFVLATTAKKNGASFSGCLFMVGTVRDTVGCGVSCGYVCFTLRRARRRFVTSLCSCFVFARYNLDCGMGSFGNVAMSSGGGVVAVSRRVVGTVRGIGPLMSRCVSCIRLVARSLAPTCVLG